VTRLKRPTTLYRLYDGNHVLLYIGATECLARRLHQHKKTQPWWENVAHMEVQEFASNSMAYDHERTAIIEEKPLHNVVHNRGIRSSTRYVDRPRFWEDKSAVITARIPVALKDKFEWKASQRRQSMSDRLRELIEQDVKKP
jgi:hypothetical protein